MADSTAPRERSKHRSAILITRERRDRGDAFDGLGLAGHTVRYLPLSTTTSLPDRPQVRQVLENVHRYHWIAVTSARAIEALDAFEPNITGPVYADRNLRWACVGPATARAVQERICRTPDLVSENLNAADLGRALAERAHPAGDRVLFLCAANARPDLPETLRRKDVVVDPLVTYRVDPAPPAAEDLHPPPPHESWTAIVFTSALAVRTLAKFLRDTGITDVQITRYLVQNHPVVLGESAEAALRELGVPAWLRAPRPVMEDLALALAARLEESATKE